MHIRSFSCLLVAVAALTAAQGSPGTPKNPAAGAEPAISEPVSTGAPHVCIQDYPPISVRLGEQGTTTVAFTITARGTVSNVRVERSSGFERLDDAAVECARQWRYLPARRGVSPVAVPWRAEVSWALH